MDRKLRENDSDERTAHEGIYPMEEDRVRKEIALTGEM